MNDKIEKWERWINRIQRQVMVLMMYRWFNAQFEDIVNANPKLRPGMPFLDYFRAIYADGAAMSVRRQAKPHRDSVSFAGLLQDLAENPTLISRTWTRALYERPLPNGSTYSREMAHKLADSAYKTLADSNGEYLDAIAILDDLAALEVATMATVTLTDQAIAHDDKGGVKLPTLPTFDELDRAIRVLESLVRKYSLLLTGASFLSLTPVDQTNARSIFYFPWIDKDAVDLTGETCDET